VATRTATTDDKDLELLDSLAKARSDLAAQIGRRIIGQHDIVDRSESVV
jgi:hypothetical protein